MKTFLVSVILLASLAPTRVFAGYGAIAYNYSTGANAESHGWGSYYQATSTALALCGPGCSIVNWEYNSCIALATGYGSWGESHGYSTANDAINAAISTCGWGCSWRLWACN